METWIAELRGIVFDLDQTLHDLREARETWLAEATARSGMSRAERERWIRDILDAHGDAVGAGPGFFTAVCLRLGWPVQDPAACRERWCEGLIRHLKPDPAMVPMLERLSRAYRLGICTNGSRFLQRPKILRLGIANLTDPILISEEAGLRKPDPAAFLRFATAWACQPREILMVGDHVDQDVRGARSAGLRTAWIAQGRTWPGPDPGPDLVLDRTRDLEPALRPRP